MTANETNLMPHAVPGALPGTHRPEIGDALNQAEVVVVPGLRTLRASTLRASTGRTAALLATALFATTLRASAGW